MLEKANIHGSPDLANLNNEEREAVFEWYKNNFAYNFSYKEAVDYLEEFLMYDLINDTEALDYIKQLPELQKERIGKYIGHALEPGKYVQSFYECWSSMERE